jgi:hypothetical protein
MKQFLCWLMLALIGSGVLSACDKLDDGDDGALQGVIVGDWDFSYELLGDEDTGLAFEFQQVIFRQDGTCSITYPEGSLEGTWRAGNSVIKIEGSIDNGDMQTMLWRVQSFSARQLVAEYDFEINGTSVKAVVTLDKVL